MKFGVVGLGRTGANLARHAIEKRHKVVGYDPSAAPLEEADRLEHADSLASLVAQLPLPRVVFVYVPHGTPTDSVCEQLRPLLTSGDVIVDGGNSHWADSQRRHEMLSASGVRFLDMGTSGGVRGARHGACFMVGGERDAYSIVEPEQSIIADGEGFESPEARHTFTLA